MGNVCCDTLLIGGRGRTVGTYTRIRTRERTTELLTLQMNHSYIHYSYFQKKDLVSLFSPFALNTACIKATRHKELRCLSTKKKWPL